jgi:hypothetical protein
MKQGFGAARSEARLADIAITSEGGEAIQVVGHVVAIALVQPMAVNTPYPRHARNYMDKEPKLPTPQIDPRGVADAILEAVTEPTRPAA